MTDLTPTNPEERYRELEGKYNQLRRALEASIAGLVVLDTKLQMTFTNTAFCKQVGYHADELLGKSFIDMLVQKNNVSLVSRELQTAEGDTEKTAELTCKTKEGAPLYIWTQIRSLYDDSGDKTGFSLATRDITEQKLQEAKLRKMNEMMVGRELEMKDLKKEVAAYKKKFGEMK